MAKIVYNRAKKLNILGKIISLTGDNTRNNDIYTRYLYKLLIYLYNEYLDLMPVYYQEIRFKGKESLIDYMAHVKNLIIKAILKSLGSSMYKDVYKFLDRVKERD